MSKLRFISDAGHGWLEVPTVDVIKAGITPSRYSYVDADNGRTYLEEDCDMAAYLAAIGCIFDSAVLWGNIKEIFINGDAWIRELPPYAKPEPVQECPWCGKECPDRYKPEGCWYPNCPDEPHA